MPLVVGDRKQRPLESYLEVGLTMVVAPDPCPRDGVRVRSAVRGWHESSYLFLDLPNDEAFLSNLWPEMPCIIRFFSEGNAGGFRTTVCSWRRGEDPEGMFIRWPEAHEVLQVRKSERIEVRIGCRVWQTSPDTAVDCTLLDISETGCGVAGALSCKCGDVVMVEFDLPDAPLIEPLECRVQNIRSMGDAAHLGCQFVSLPVIERERIRYFVSDHLDRKGVAPAQRVLIIDGEPDGVNGLVAHLESNRFDVVVAPGVVDGSHRIRLLKPAAVLVNERIPGMRGIDFCRILLRTRGLDDLPVFLYGGDGDDDLAELAKEAHLSGYIAPDSRPEAILRELKRAIQKGQ